MDDRVIEKESGRGRGRLVGALTLNCAIVLAECVGISLSFMNHGWSSFEFYTEDSNYLAFLSCILMAYFLARNLRRGIPIPRWAHVLRFVATSCLAVTFVVVVLVLAPWMTLQGEPGYQMMLLQGSMLFMHLVCPVLSLVSFALFESDEALTKHDVPYALVPTAIYACVSIVLNVTRTIEGPYPFLRVYQQPIWASVLWVAIIGCGAFGLARAVLALARKAGNGRRGEAIAGSR